MSMFVLTCPDRDILSPDRDMLSADRDMLSPGVLIGIYSVLVS